MAVRFTTRVGRNAAVTTGPIGGLIVVGACALVLGGLAGWALPFAVGFLKLVLIGIGLCALYGAWWVYREARAQSKWLAIPEDVRERLIKEREAERKAQNVAALAARRERIRQQRLSQRPW